MLKAGYSKSTASSDPDSVFGREDVAAYIQEKRGMMEQKTETDLEWLVGHLRAIISTNPGDILDETVAKVDLSALAPELRATLGEVEVIETTQPRGPKDKYKRKKGRTIKARTITNSDRLRAIETLAKLLGLMQDKVKVDAEDRLIDLLRSGMKRTDAADG